MLAEFAYMVKKATNIWKHAWKKAWTIDVDNDKDYNIFIMNLFLDNNIYEELNQNLDPTYHS